MADIIFASMAGTAGAARQALLWAKSIRSFAGRFAESPIWLLVPERKERLPASIRVELEKADVRLVPFDISDAELNFPYAGKSVAAGAAESLAQGRTPLLVWMDRDSLVIREPLPLLLAEDKAFGYQPVDHTLIGSPFSKPPDPFWSMIYAYCEVDARQLAPMTTSVDEEEIRPYYNAGMLVVRPQRNLLRKWSDTFKRLYQLPAFAPYYESGFLHRLFTHQAILSGIILANTDVGERQELPYLVNYPLHMHDAYPASRRISHLNFVFTFRYDTLAEEAHWDRIIAIDEPLKSWLYTQRREIGLI